jgi:hypothetical protein
MLQTTEIEMFSSRLLWMLQIPLQSRTPEETALIFSGPRFFVALISGVILAFAFQLLFTNLSVAAGISYLGRRSRHHEDSDSNMHSEHHSQSHPVRKISFGLGLWTLITVSIALFVACLLAVRLSLLFNPFLGAITGLVIWAAYFSLMVWLSSTTVGSFLGSAMNSVMSGFQTIFNTASTLVGGKMASDRVVATAEATASAVRRELLGTGTKDSSSIRDMLEDYVENLRTPELDTQQIRREFEDLLRDPDLRELGNTNAEALKHIDQKAFKDLVQSRTDLSPREVDRLSDQLYRSWQRFLRQQSAQPSDPFAEVQNYLRTALPEQLKSSDLNTKLDQLMAMVNRDQKGTAQSQNPAQDSQQNAGFMNRAFQFGLTSLMGTVLGRQDLSDLDAEQILSQLRQLRDRIMGQTETIVYETTGQTLPSSGRQTIRADVEHYLLTAHPWQMNPATLEQDFREVLYDPAADPGTVRQEIESLNRDLFVQILRQKGLLTQAEIDEISSRLEQIRTEVLSQVRTEELREQSQDLYGRMEHYLLSVPKATLVSDTTQQDFVSVLEESDIEAEALQLVLNQANWNRFHQILVQRQDLSEEELILVIQHLEAGRDRALQDIQVRLAREESIIKGLQMRVESYLRETHKEELNPEGIKRDLQTLVQDPQVGMIALRSRIAHFDRDTFVKLLSQRQDLNEEQVNQTIDQVQSTLMNLVHTPQSVADKTKEQYDKVTGSLADYLRNTHLEELDPEGLKRDLARLLEDPKMGVLALRRRLAQIDRETLVKLLSQREDLSEEQVNRSIDQLQIALRQIARAPRRVASRTQNRIVDFESNLENYLRNTHKDELNPEGIKRDLQLLLQDPRSGLGNLSDRLAHMDRSTLVALLAQRPDITEEEANRIVDQILSVRDQFVKQVRDIQRKLQSAIDRVFARIRNYLNSLERPELNYDGIRRDLRQLFSDPQAGFDSLRDRLGHFNRDTLVAILSSRDDISEADANRIIDQIEGARNGVLQRAERIQHAAQERLAEIKLQAQRQAEETRKAAEIAAWWLFGTASVSAILSAIAGAIAVGL